ncbi:staygreen family protein [Bacillus sp. REN3]|uniref:staygreen family protein n=1 Tax=Bacillus sp. REN3 TaxID=2802440 RepID=UPI001AED6089|nr:staygreen family protein [Bacillus sp. REN3]
MNKFKPEKLAVKLIPPATPFEPVDRRKYTLTHSDQTGELFLSIGAAFDDNAINFLIRDEVLAEWTTREGEYLLYGKAHISNGEYDLNMSKIRHLIFKKEMDLALTALIYGDKSLFTNYPWLLDAPIYIQFQSVFPEFNETIYYGTPRNYLNIATKTVQTQG